MKFFPDLKIPMALGLVGVVMGLLTIQVKSILVIGTRRDPKVAICIRIIYDVKDRHATEVRVTGGNLRKVAIVLVRVVLSHQSHRRNRRKTRRAN